MPTAAQPAPAITERPQREQIGTRPCPRCALCGSPGDVLYQDQRDRLFGAPGTWDLKRCSGPDCGLIWLDPMPLAEEIGKAYAHYYTHASRDGAGRKGFLKRVYELMKTGYLANKYNYRSDLQSLAARILGRLLPLFPVRRMNLDGQVRFLRALPEGRLLDVGCGSGDWLMFMRSLGWRVAGVDFDENALKVAREKGLEVTCGALEQANFPEGTFDAVTLNHVIEHVPDPVQTLAECRRVLKPGGKLVLFTPNALSLGHRIFKQDWRGLETPRHLHIFSTRSMPALLELAGFKNITIRPDIGPSVVYESIQLRRGVVGPPGPRRWNGPVGLMSRFLALVELCLVKPVPSVADCLGAIAVK